MSNVQIMCAWCQKVGIKRYSLSMGSEVKSFCSEKCFAACRRAYFKRNKVRARREAALQASRVHLRMCLLASSWKHCAPFILSVLFHFFFCPLSLSYLTFGNMGSPSNVHNHLFFSFSGLGVWILRGWMNLMRTRWSQLVPKRQGLPNSRTHRLESGKIRGRGSWGTSHRPCMARKPEGTQFTGSQWEDCSGSFRNPAHKF